MMLLVLGYLLLGFGWFYFMAYGLWGETLPPQAWWCSWPPLSFMLFVVALWPVTLVGWLFSVQMEAAKMEKSGQIRSYWAARFVRCLQHGEQCCWVQFDGSHISKEECTCRDGALFCCPIDAHAVIWRLENPDFDDLGQVVDVHSLRIGEKAE